ncbi:MAG: polysaccharide biosynthesis protein [Planctomycetota bacterium]
MSGLELSRQDVLELLGREPLDALIKAIGPAVSGKRVLVTGGGGSLGTAFVREAIRAAAARVAAVDRAEAGLFELETGLGETGRLETHVADVTDRVSLERVLDAVDPEVLVHAAAHKHVPLMERHPIEAARNNVLGSAVVLAASAARAATVVLVSTDKAVEPTSVLGRSKRCAERLWLEGPSGSARRLVVRLPNLLGSAGSVLVRFLDQARRGGPLTVTDARAERFFVTAPEAAGLIGLALTEGHDRDLFALHPGEPTSIALLARRVLSRFDLEPDSIRMTGLRPGDRPSERLWDSVDTFESLSIPHAFRRSAPRVSGDSFDSEALEAAVREGDDAEVRRLLEAQAR